jgi:hypothetical protein
MASADEIMRVRIELQDTDPKVWRQVEVPVSVTLGDLHNIIQAAMGWDDDHMHAFQSGRNELNEKGATLAGLSLRGLKRFTYVYDFGDSWIHEIRLQRRSPADPGVAYPRLVDGGGRCPPEDIGGVWGYYASLEALADPDHEDHDQMREWYGDDPVDPASFDRTRANARLGHLAKWFAKRGRKEERA